LGIVLQKDLKLLDFSFFFNLKKIDPQRSAGQTASVILKLIEYAKTSV
jgi:hypothetical protein